MAGPVFNVKSLFELTSEFVGEHGYLYSYDAFAYQPYPILEQLMKNLCAGDLYRLEDILKKYGLDTEAVWRRHCQILNIPRRVYRYDEFGECETDEVQVTFKAIYHHKQFHQLLEILSLDTAPAAMFDNPKPTDIYKIPLHKLKDWHNARKEEHIHQSVYKSFLLKWARFCQKLVLSGRTSLYVAQHTELAKHLISHVQTLVITPLTPSCYYNIRNFLKTLVMEGNLSHIRLLGSSLYDEELSELIAICSGCWCPLENNILFDMSSAVESTCRNLSCKTIQNRLGKEETSSGNNHLGRQMSLTSASKNLHSSSSETVLGEHIEDFEQWYLEHRDLDDVVEDSSCDADASRSETNLKPSTLQNVMNDGSEEKPTSSSGDLSDISILVKCGSEVLDQCSSLSNDSETSIPDSPGESHVVHDIYSGISSANENSLEKIEIGSSPLPMSECEVGDIFGSSMSVTVEQAEETTDTLKGVIHSDSSEIVKADASSKTASTISPLKDSPGTSQSCSSKGSSKPAGIESFVMHNVLGTLRSGDILSQFLPHWHSLKRLSTRLSTGLVESILTLVKKNQLSHLVVDTAMRDTFFESVVNVLSSFYCVPEEGKIRFSPLEVLQICGCELIRTGETIDIKHKLAAVRILDLSWNSFQDETFDLLLEYILADTALVGLRLASCGLWPLKICRILEALERRDIPMEELNLNGNIIDGLPCEQAITQFVIHSRSLRKLSLSGLRLSDLIENCPEFARAVANHPNLETLDISGSFLGTLHLHLVESILCNAPSLRRFNVAFNLFRGEELIAMSERVQKHKRKTKLEHLCLSRNIFTLDERKQIVENLSGCAHEVQANCVAVNAQNLELLAQM